MEKEVKVENERVFALSDGRECKIVKGKGNHVKEATRASGGDGSKFLYAMIAQVTTIDGNVLVMEDLDDLYMSDVLKIQSEFTEINF